MTTPTEKLYTPRFIGLCISAFLFFASFNMIIPELPARLENMGGGDYKGWIITLFTITAGLSRPFSGRLADTVGRVPVMAIGMIVSLLCTLLYPFMAIVSVFLWLRLAHGFSTGFTPTGNSAYVADTVPTSRRGEAIGMVGFSGSLAMSGAPVLGSYLVQVHSFELMVFVSVALSVFSLIILLFLPESLPNRQAFRWELLKLPPSAIVEPSAISAGIVMIFVYLSFGMLLILSPELSEYWQLGNKGFLMMVFTLATMLTRLIGGRASDIYGRQVVLKIGSFGLAVGLLALSLAQTATAVIVCTAVWGVFMGLTAPIIYAWAIDTAPDNRRGQALATVYIALEIGIGFGAWVGSALYANQPHRFGWAFGFASVMSFLAGIYLLVFHQKKASIND